MRIVSLVPSVTESLLAWGITPVGCTDFCEQPELVAMGGTKNPDIDAIAKAQPDLVVVDRTENRIEDFYEIKRLGIRVLDLDVRSVDDVGPEIDKLALVVGIDPEPVTVPQGLAAFDLWAFVPIWRRPWMTIGAQTYGSTLLGRLGIDNVFSLAETDYPEVTLAEATTAGPDVVLVPSEPYSFKPDHLDELAAVAPVLEVDGQDLFWWGARTPDAARRLVDRISGFVR